MRALVLYDNQAVKSGLETGWGFSCYVEAQGHRILFDTGWNFDILEANMDKLGVDPGSLDILFISHGHWDHAGGIPSVLKRHPDLTVYVPSSISRHMKAEMGKSAPTVGIAHNPMEMYPGIISTGEIGNSREHALIVKVYEGCVLFTGCSHYGVANAVKIARRYGKVKALVGGYHDSKEFDALEGITMLMACHCTVYKEEIRKRFPEAYRECGVGTEINVDE